MGYVVGLLAGSFVPEAGASGCALPPEQPASGDEQPSGSGPSGSES